MNTINQKSIIIIITILFLSRCFSAQAQESKGTDFWLSFGRNFDQLTPEKVMLQIRIAADSDAKGTIKYTETGLTIKFSVDAGTVFTHTLSSTEKNASYNSSYYKNSKTIRIQTDVPVSVYALNTYLALADATNVLPTSVLGTEYYHLGRISSHLDYNKFDQYIVIATQDGTVVHQNGTQVATLSAGETYLRQVLFNTDISGAHITSNHPIAYFSAHTYCNIEGGGDNFFQQLPPVNTWGKKFMVPVTNRELELIRIVAAHDNTTITQEGGTIMPISGGQTSLTLNAGQWVELMITLANKGCYIQADKPVQVCSYMVGIGYPGAVNNFGGDESLCLIPPVEQSLNTVLIAPFAVSTLTSHFALIVTPTATKHNTTISIGGAAATGLSGGTWYDNTTSGRSFYNVPLTQSSDTYLITNKAGVVVYGYGFGNSISYYYPAGSAMRILDGSIGVTILGTVFPFVHYAESEYKKLFPTIARLYDASLCSQEPAAILAEDPIHSNETMYYDGVEFIPNTPKYPGYLGKLNNPGYPPVNWAALGYNADEMDQTVLLTGEMPVTPVGLYKFEKVAQGDYILVLSRGGFANRFARITVENEDIFLNHRELIPGDANGDFTIDALDIEMIIQKFSQYSDPLYDPFYDLNGDLRIDGADISLLKTFLQFYIDLYEDTNDCFSKFINK